jgi:hypothetical protein
MSNGRCIPEIMRAALEWGKPSLLHWSLNKPRRIAIASMRSVVGASISEKHFPMDCDELCCFISDLAASTHTL